MAGKKTAFKPDYEWTVDPATGESVYTEIQVDPATGQSVARTILDESGNPITKFQRDELIPVGDGRVMKYNTSTKQVEWLVNPEGEQVVDPDVIAKMKQMKLDKLKSDLERERLKHDINSASAEIEVDYDTYLNKANDALSTIDRMIGNKKVEFQSILDTRVLWEGRALLFCLD